MNNHICSRIVASLLASGMMISLVSCGENETADNGTITLTDQAGREVVLDGPAESVVSCYYVTSYAMLSLGLSDRIVGIENKADKRAIYGMTDPDLASLTQVGSLKECNVEAIAALNPDVVLMPVKLTEHAETLTSLGIPVLIVDPETQENLNGMLTLIGEACGVSERAEALIAYYDEKTETINSYTDGKDIPTVYMGGNSSYMTTAPSGMYQNGLIELAGGENVGKDLEGDYWTEVSYETILAMNPDIIIIPSGADYTAEDLCSDSQLAALDAVKNGEVYSMPSAFEEWDSPVPSGILGALWMTSVLHEDVYTSTMFTDDVTEFYQTFYGFTPDVSLLN